MRRVAKDDARGRSVEADFSGLTNAGANEGRGCARRRKRAAGTRARLPDCTVALRQTDGLEKMGVGAVAVEERTAPPQAGWSGGLGLVRLDERRVERVAWLWEGRIPLGKVSLVVGDPDVGKSFVLLDLAARVSRGEGVAPETGRPRGVLLLCADDDVDDTVLPRLVACGADLSRVVWVSSFVEEAWDHSGLRKASESGRRSGSPGLRKASDPATPGAVAGALDGRVKARRTTTPRDGVERRMVSLGRDVGRLEAAALAMGDCGLIVIDPVSAYLEGTDSNSNGEVRRVLWRLGEMARSLGAAVVLVSHHRKAGAASVLHRAIGSLAFTAASRVVLAVVEDPAVGGRKLLLPVKMNLLPASSGRAFRIEEGRVAWEPDAVSLTADEMNDLAASGLATLDRKAEVAKWLKDVLRGGAMASEELHRLAAAEQIPRKVLWGAKKAVGAKVVRDGKSGRWRWEMPKEVPWYLREEALLRAGGLGVGEVALREGVSEC